MRNSYYNIDKKILNLLSHINIDSIELLKKSNLPIDLFNHSTITVNSEQYICFLSSLKELSDLPNLAIMLGCFENIEAFSPPIFASYCSKNGDMCIERLSVYKRLIGPIKFDISKTSDLISVEIKYNDDVLNKPQFLLDVEMIFIVNLLRKATKFNISPIKVFTSNHFLTNEFIEFYKCSPIHSDKNCLVFSKTEMNIDFISQNELMWGYFEPELNKRLNDLEIDDSMSAKVRSVLVELLPAGECSIDVVSFKLGLTSRTLQRKLKEENTTYQKQLNHTRELLAKHYLKKGSLPLIDIAFLLGFQDINSLVRAFRTWTGISITEFKANN